MKDKELAIATAIHIEIAKTFLIEILAEQLSAAPPRVDRRLEGAMDELIKAGNLLNIDDAAA